MQMTDVACRLAMVNAIAEQEDCGCYVGKVSFSSDYSFFDRDGLKWFRWNGGPAPVDDLSQIQIVFNGHGKGAPSEPFTALGLSWQQDMQECNVVAYRIVTERR